MEKVIRNRWELVKNFRSPKLEEVILWSVFILLPIGLFAYYILNTIFTN